MKLTAEAEMDYSEIWVVGHVFYDTFKVSQIPGRVTIMIGL
jgi:hypothetical protein